jgi:hypothetical protein
MWGNTRVRTGLAVVGSLGVLTGIALVGGPAVDAEVVTVAGLATGIEGDVTYPPEQVGDPDVEEVIEPYPNVLLPDEGTAEDEVLSESEITFDLEDVLAVDRFVVQTQGDLGTATVLGGVFSDSLVDNLSAFEGRIVAESLRASCGYDEGAVTALNVDFEELFIDGVEIDEVPAPGTVVDIPGVGEVTMNIQEERAGRVEVTAMQIDFDLSDGDVDGVRGVLRLGIAECGLEEVDEVDDQQVVPEADLADPYDGDPAFTG